MSAATDSQEPISQNPPEVSLAKHRSTRCFLIDPDRQTVEEIPFEGGLQRIQELLGDQVKIIETVSLDKKSDTLYRDKAHLKRSNKYFVYGRVFKVKGCAVVLGRSPKGNFVSPAITLNQLQSEILFEGDTALGAGFRK